MSKKRELVFREKRRMGLICREKYKAKNHQGTVTAQNGGVGSPKLLNQHRNIKKLLEENIGRTLFGNIFLDLPLKVKEVKAKINKWDLIKLKNFFAQQRKL